MTEERRIADDTALGLFAYLDLTMAQTGFAVAGEAVELSERLDLSRLAAGLLARVAQLCDGFAGGQPRAVEEIQSLRAPIDEYWNLTRGRDIVEQRIAAMVISLVELELSDKIATNISESAAELISDATVGWRIVDLASQAITDELESDPHRRDGLSLYARRVIGEAAVLLQGVVVRRVGIRLALTGNSDEELSATTAVVDEILSAVAARIAGLGLSV